MSVTPTNLTQGPALLYFGAFGATEPADSAITSAPSNSTWTDLGGTQGGVMFEQDLTYAEQTVDQLIDTVGARLTKRALTVTAKLAETTLNNLYTAMNSLATQGSGSGYATLDPLTTNSATQPTYTALIVDGWAPTTGTSEVSCRRRIIIRKCLAQAKVQLSYDMSNNATYDVTWNAYYVSNSIPPFHVVDQTS